MIKAQYIQLRAQISTLSDLNEVGLMVQSVLLRKLSKVIYEYIVDRFHRFDFMLDEMKEGIQYIIDIFGY